MRSLLTTISIETCMQCSNKETLTFDIKTKEIFFNGDHASFGNPSRSLGTPTAQMRDRRLQLKTFYYEITLFFSIISTIHSLFWSDSAETVAIDFDSLMKAKETQILGKPFPHFVAANEKGSISNDSLLGKVVLINFWFEGCHPCLAEFDALNELAGKLTGNKNFEFISFRWDNTETIHRVAEKYKLQFEVFQTSQKECRRLNQASGYPTTVIVDKHGIIKYWIMGGDTDPTRAREFVMTTLLPKIQQEL